MRVWAEVGVVCGEREEGPIPRAGVGEAGAGLDTLALTPWAGPGLPQTAWKRAWGREAHPVCTVRGRAGASIGPLARRGGDLGPGGRVSRDPLEWGHWRQAQVREGQ